MLVELSRFVWLAVLIVERDVGSLLYVVVLLCGLHCLCYVE